MDIGNKIKKLRQEKNMTLEELSSLSKVAVATLSRIENGKMTGTLDSHVNIAGALGIPLGQLYQDINTSSKGERVEVKSAHNAKEIFVHGKNTVFEMLTKYSFSKNMMPVLATLKKNTSSPTEQLKSGAEKFIYVLTGAITLEIDNQSYPLKKGDSIYFDASVSHVCKNKTHARAQYLMITSPPAL